MSSRAGTQPGRNPDLRPAAGLVAGERPWTYRDAGLSTSATDMRNRVVATPWIEELAGIARHELGHVAISPWQRPKTYVKGSRAAHWSDVVEEARVNLMLNAAGLPVEIPSAVDASAFDPTNAESMGKLARLEFAIARSGCVYTDDTEGGLAALRDDLGPRDSGILSYIRKTVTNAIRRADYTRTVCRLGEWLAEYEAWLVEQEAVPLPLPPPPTPQEGAETDGQGQPNPHGQPQAGGQPQPGTGQPQPGDSGGQGGTEGGSDNEGAGAEGAEGAEGTEGTEGAETGTETGTEGTEGKTGTTGTSSTTTASGTEGAEQARETREQAVARALDNLLRGTQRAKQTLTDYVQKAVETAATRAAEERAKAVTRREASKTDATVKSDDALTGTASEKLLNDAARVAASDKALPGTGYRDRMPGQMTIHEPPLVIRIRGKGHRRHSDEGTLPSAWERMHSDGAVFRTRGGKRAGTVLIDGSGSMGWSREALEAILASSADRTVAIYAGCGSKYGKLIVIAKRARRAEKIATPGGWNVVDLPALLWLESQPAPRVWISDGIVTGIDDVQARNITAACANVVSRAGIRRVSSWQELVKPAEGAET